MATGDATLRAATRGSALARLQTDLVASALSAADPAVSVDPVVVRTEGDRRGAEPLWRLGGRGVFAKEVQAAVLDGRADLAVHSAKDLPSTTPPGLVIAAIPERADPRDGLVGATLDGLGPGAIVATGAVRRRAQLAARRPDLGFVELRGNIETRLARAGSVGAVVVAVAAVTRLGLADHLTEVLDVSVLVPQAGQGAVAVECREDDDRTRALLAAIEHGPSRAAVDAERAFLAELGGGCDLPAGAHATVGDDGTIELRALLATLDGRVVLDHRARGTEPLVLGRSVARHLLDRSGGQSLLAEAGPQAPTPSANGAVATS